MLNYQITESIAKAYKQVQTNEGVIDTATEFVKDAYSDVDQETGERKINWKDVGMDAALAIGSLLATAASGGAASGAIGATAARTAGRVAAKTAVKTLSKGALRTTAGLSKAALCNRIGNHVGNAFDKNGEKFYGSLARLGGNVAALRTPINGTGSLVGKGLFGNSLVKGGIASTAGNYAIDALVDDQDTANNLKTAKDYIVWGGKKSFLDDATKKNGPLAFKKGAALYTDGASDILLSDLIDDEDDYITYNIPRNREEYDKMLELRRRTSSPSSKNVFDKESKKSKQSDGFFGKQKDVFGKKKSVFGKQRSIFDNNTDEENED